MPLEIVGMTEKTGSSRRQPSRIGKRRNGQVDRHFGVLTPYAPATFQEMPTGLATPEPTGCTHPTPNHPNATTPSGDIGSGPRTRREPMNRSHNTTVAKVRQQ